MEVWLVPILVALIGGPVMWMLSRFEKRNSEQHGENMKVLVDIDEKVDRIDSRLDDHIHWHLQRRDD